MSRLNNSVFVVSPAALLSGATTFDIFRRAGGVCVGTERLRLGLYAPFPVIGHPGQGPVTLVWGFAAVREAAAAGLETLNCVGIPDNHAAALEIALEFEQRPGDFSPAEQYALWRLLKDAEPIAGDVVARIGSLLGSSADAFRARMLRFEALPNAAREAVLNETIDLKTAERCRALPEECLRWLSDPQYLEAGLSFSSTRQLLSLLREIWLRDGLAPDDCLKLLEGAVADSEPVAYLRRRRYPELVKREQRFEELRRETTAGSGVELSAPPYFEGDSFELRFRFSSRAELTRRREALHHIEDRFDEFLELL
ncbi:MAG: hypothetical protein EA428_13270 [Spirochaetaceae bacterium]|nr:MAG: hypothetical protein EA428_13270 [Spirochaetaceae bacterium]